MKVGVVGTGFMGDIHLSTYKKMNDVSIVSVVDVDGAKARTAADRYGAAAYESVHEMLAGEPVDGVSICTSDEHHVEPTLMCLRAGVPVLLEKPIATTLADADEIIAAAEDSGTALLLGHVLRFEERYRMAAESVRKGAIGEVVSIFARRLNAASQQDRLKGRVSVLSFLGVHDFDICTWIAGGSPQKVYADARRGFLQARGYDVEDQVFTTVRYDNNVVACIESGWVFPDTHPRKADFALEVVGTAGVINLDLMDLGMSICGSDGFVYPSFSHGVEGELRHFVSCAAGTVRPDVDGAAGRSALELAIAASESVRTGRAVDLPL